jgi:hypothetical protein
MQKLPLAATAIVLRPLAPRGFQVLLTSSPSGDHRFPGDMLRAEDVSEAALRRAAGLSLLQAQVTVGGEISPRQAVGLRLAAARTLFQKSGILLAIHDIAQPATDGSVGGFPLLKPLNASGLNTDFGSILDATGLYCDIAALIHFSRWQEIMGTSTSYDNHFFLASAPVSDGFPVSPPRNLWLSPEAALRRFREHAMSISFPTFASLRTLAEYDSVQSVLKDYRRAGM